MSRLQRALNVLKTPLRSYNEVAQRYPFETGVVTTVVKTSAADLFAQKVGRVGVAVHCVAARLATVRQINNWHSMVDCMPMPQS